MNNQKATNITLKNTDGRCCSTLKMMSVKGKTEIHLQTFLDGALQSGVVVFSGPIEIARDLYSGKMKFSEL